MTAQFELADLDAADVKQVVDQASHLAGLASNDVVGPSHLVWVTAAELQHAGSIADRRERPAQLVGQGGEKFVLAPIFVQQLLLGLQQRFLGAPALDNLSAQCGPLALQNRKGDRQRDQGSQRDRRRHGQRGDGGFLHQAHTRVRPPFDDAVIFTAGAQLRQRAIELGCQRGIRRSHREISFADPKRRQAGNGADAQLAKDVVRAPLLRSEAVELAPQDHLHSVHHGVDQHRRDFRVQRLHLAARQPAGGDPDPPSRQRGAGELRGFIGPNEQRKRYRHRRCTEEKLFLALGCAA